MTNKEILEQAIKKAVDKGFDESVFWEDYNITGGDSYQPTNYEYQIIFSHDFAKAFWGNEDVFIQDGFINTQKHGAYNLTEGRFIPHYHYHLQQMVLEEEPLKYIEKFLERHI